MRALLVTLTMVMVFALGCRPASKSKLEARAEKQLKQLRRDWPNMFKDTVIKWKYDTTIMWHYDTVIVEKIVKGETQLVIDTTAMEQMEATMYKRAIDLYLNTPPSGKDKAYIDNIKDSIAQVLLRERRSNDKRYGKIWIDPIAKDTLGISLRIWSEDNKIKYSIKTEAIKVSGKGQIKIHKEDETQVNYAKCPEYRYHYFWQFWLAAGLALLFFIAAFYLGVRSRT